MAMNDLRGMVTHVQRMSLHDGPGMRTTIFFKGCNLRCKWCHNPETFSLNQELGWIRNKCIRCGVCLEKCPSGALSVQDDEIARNRNVCIGCHTCVEECYAGAHHLIGKTYSTEDLCNIAEEDRGFFENSGGGVTVSGGEPTVQYSFLKELLKALHEKDFHVALQTNLKASWDKYEELLPYVDYFMCDLKVLDKEAHRYWTGTDNELILANMVRLDASGKRYCVRTPVVPGVNDRKEQLRQMSDFVSKLKHAEKYELIPFHPLASYKYKDLGMKYEFETVKEIPKNEFKELKQTFEFNINYQ